MLNIYTDTLVFFFFFKKYIGLYVRFWEGICKAEGLPLVTWLVGPVTLEEPTSCLVLRFKAVRALDPARLPTPSIIYTQLCVWVFLGGIVTWPLWGSRRAYNPQRQWISVLESSAWRIGCGDGNANTPCLSLKTLWQEVLRQMKLGVH